MNASTKLLYLGLFLFLGCTPAIVPDQRPGSTPSTGTAGAACDVKQAAILREADFISVGTNDLMQFLFAADRGTPALANRYDLLSPPMLELLATLSEQCRSAGVSLSVCGEAAARRWCA